jgi:hypothetical protein
LTAQARVSVLVALATQETSAVMMPRPEILSIDPPKDRFLTR